MHGLLHLRDVEPFGGVEGGARVVWRQHQWLMNRRMSRSSRRSGVLVRELEVMAAPEMNGNGK
jgi:hypothetical protein